jgi:hypothetical protein
MLIELRDCPRCLGRHPALPVERLAIPILRDWKWWGTCPTTHEPILLTDPHQGAMDDILERAIEICMKAIDDEIVGVMLADARRHDHESRGYW